MKPAALSLVALVYCSACFAFPALAQHGEEQSEIPREAISESGPRSGERFYSLCISKETVTTSEFADYSMPNRGFHGSARAYGSAFVDGNLDVFGYLQLTEGPYRDIWATNVMVFAGPRLYLRHPENLSGIFLGTGIGIGWKSIIVELETETVDYFALTGMLCLGFHLMFTSRFGIEGAYYRSAELVSSDKFRYKQVALGVTFGEPR